MLKFIKDGSANFAERFRYHRKPPSLRSFPLQAYQVEFTLDRLVLGVDNIRHDVFLSPTFVSATRKIISLLISRHAGVERNDTPRGRQNGWAKEVDSYQQLYLELMQDALNKAKGQSDVQIRYLAQAAVLKMVLEEIRTQYDHLVGRLKKAVRRSELTIDDDLAESPKLKGKLQKTLQSGEQMKQQVGLEVCNYLGEVEQKSLYTMHEAIFGKPTPFFNDLLAAPLLHAEQPDNEFFLIAAYDLTLGRRIEDPDKYSTVLFFIKQLFNNLDRLETGDHAASLEQRLAVPAVSEAPYDTKGQQASHEKYKSWIQHLENPDALFNWRRTRARLKEIKKTDSDFEKRKTLKAQIKKQQALLNFFYRQFKKNALIDRIVASYEMQPEYLNYCPPLTPYQIVQYLLTPKSRKVVKNRLKRMKTLYGRDFPLGPLNRKIKVMEQITASRRKVHLIRFFKSFSRYYRDKCNFELAREAMERINIATEDKMLTLSRENNTLFEFLLPHEQTSEKAPIVNHVVLKADVRGSTDITYQMNERGLNPASYFSLNFFDPISEILSEFDATKVFIEGDAIILAIFERENTPADWYSVARACGLALNMLLIIRRYNEKSKKARLPVMELGIGISYLDKTPTFLFDANNRIMISPAINQADRLSSCSKTGRLLFGKKKRSFNLYVFQTFSEKEMATTADDLLTRYNVNGVELSPTAFAKLSEEIDLKLLQGRQVEKIVPKYKLYTGKFPTKSGRYQRLVIREAHIPVVNPDTLKTVKISSRKYYEVCTNPVVYKLARQVLE